MFLKGYHIMLKVIDTNAGTSTPKKIGERLGAGANGECFLASKHSIRKVINGTPNYKREKANLCLMGILISYNDNNKTLEMPYYNGKTVDEYIKEMQNKDVDKKDQENVFAKINEIALKIETTVYDLYKKYNIVHKDIKQENIIVNLDDEKVSVNLIDFGSAGKAGSSPKSLGTNSYFAPEILDSEDDENGVFTFATDIYATGKVIKALIDLSITICPRVRRLENFKELQNKCNRMMSPQPSQRLEDSQEQKDDKEAELSSVFRQIRF